MPTFDEASRRHAQYYADVLYAADKLYQGGHESLRQGLDLFDREWSNIQLGQAWAAAAVDRDDAAAQLCAEYPDRGAYCLHLRQKPEERIRWLEASLAAARRLHNRYAEGNHLGKLGLAYADLGDWRRAFEFHERRLQIAREIDDQSGQLEGLINLGIAYDNVGEPGRAVEFYEQALLIARQAGERRAEGSILGDLGCF
jgi:tetratricopeptide (TPR) repeat protein